MNSGLMQMYPLLDKLPKGGIAALLQARPDLLGPLKTANVISSDTADAVQLIQGLTSYMATEMKPAGLGSLREYEFDAFRARLPTLLESEAGPEAGAGDDTEHERPHSAGVAMDARPFRAAGA